MTATKKTVLLLLALIVAGVGLTVYVSQDVSVEPTTQAPTVLFAEDDIFVGGAVDSEPEPVFDRDQFVADMREAVLARSDDNSAVSIANVDVANEPAAEPVLSVDDEIIEELVREVRWCDATVLETNFVATWPDGIVAVVEREGARVFTYETLVVHGTSSDLVPETKVLAQFSSRPQQRVEPACLIHGYVGITTGGRLIHNNDVVLYQNRSEGERIGYAFDGNPLYGVAADTTPLDVCGGHQVDGEYRYQLRTDEDFVLGCFVSEPDQVPQV